MDNDAPDSAGITGAVGNVASLYLGNILYAIERCALSLEDEGRATDAAFYRGIGRKLATAYGDAKTQRNTQE